MTTSGEQLARDALNASMAKNRTEVALAGETIDLLRSEVRAAVAEGIAGAMTDEAAERFWKTGIDVLQRQATVSTGRFVLDGVWALAKRVFWVGIFVVTLYSIGGWTVVKSVTGAIWHAVTKGPP